MVAGPTRSSDGMTWRSQQDFEERTVLLTIEPWQIHIYCKGLGSVEGQRKARKISEIAVTHRHPPDSPPSF